MTYDGAVDAERIDGIPRQGPALRFTMRAPCVTTAGGMESNLRATPYNGRMLESNIHDAALACLLAADVDEKLRLTALAAGRWRDGNLELNAEWSSPVRELTVPGRPPRPELVSPRNVATRSLGTTQGRAALLHAVAHIEFNAINLAWDAVYRFRQMPREFVDDWVAVAADEARHFSMLRGRMSDYGLAYGDLGAHNGLWEMALKTAHDPLARMALVPRVLEARGLDVTPGMIERLRQAGDLATVAILEVILADEVAHVAAGSRWFRWLCARSGRDPSATFWQLVNSFAPGGLRGPFNVAARTAAGFAPDELAVLAELCADLSASGSPRTA